MDQDALETLLGKTRARALWDLSLESVQLVRDLIAENSMDCGFSPGIIHADHRARFVTESHAYAEKLRTDYSYDKIKPLNRDEIRSLVGSPGYHGGTLDMGGGHIHPLRFALGLARTAIAAGVQIFEQSKATNIEGDITTDQAQIKASHTLLCCNGYMGALDPSVAARVMPINNFIAATAPLGADRAKALIAQNHAIADSRFVVNYFRRSQDNRLLFGGGESYGYRFPNDIAAKVRKPMTQVFPQLSDVKIDYAWGGTLGITMNRMPHFARLSGNVINASGYSGHGVALATLGGKLAARAIAGQAEKFDLMASVPSPRFPGGASLRTPLLIAAMTWFVLRDRL